MIAFIFVILSILSMIGFFSLWVINQKQKKKLNDLESKEDTLNRKLASIDQFKKKVETNLYEKITKNNKYIEQSQTQLKADKEKFDAYILSKTNQLKLDEASARQKLQALETAQEAIQRIINGYNDEYIVPHIQLIDELTNNQNIDAVGSQLKKCRAEKRNMIISNRATEGSNDTHGKILLDYFTVKSEELLAKVKHNNYGKLKKELEDAYSLTSYYAHHSQLLSKISKSYYDLCQDELKLASTIHIMRVAEKEEQRELREQMREEERVRKEYEKAIKDAAKEEAMLQKAMEQAKRAYDTANAEQKAKYEQQLADLELRLKEAEEKNQRAVSMAQQTRAGNVYLISNIGSFGDNMMKIGMTRRLEPMDRVRELGDASVPFQFDVHAIIYSDDAPKLEKELHHAFNDLRVNKVNYRKEFFRVSVEQVKAKLDELGIQAHFTLAAEAAEYRETLRIESMTKDEQDNLLNTLLEKEIIEDE